MCHACEDSMCRKEEMVCKCTNCEENFCHVCFQLCSKCGDAGLCERCMEDQTACQKCGYTCDDCSSAIMLQTYGNCASKWDRISEQFYLPFSGQSKELSDPLFVFYDDELSFHHGKCFEDFLLETGGREEIAKTAAVASVLSMRRFLPAGVCEIIGRYVAQSYNDRVWDDYWPRQRRKYVEAFLLKEKK